MGFILGGTDDFDRAALATASKWVQRGRMIFSDSISNGTRGGTVGVANALIVVTGRSLTTYEFAYGHFGYGPSDIGSWANDAINHDAGDKIEMVCSFRAVAFANLGADQLHAIGLASGGSGSAGGAVMNKTSAADRILVGVDSAGDIFVVTANGASVTVTDTNVNYTANTWIRIKIVFTKGTDVVVTVDDNAATTVTLTLPSKIDKYLSGHGTESVGNETHVMPGEYRLTKA